MTEENYTREVQVFMLRRLIDLEEKLHAARKEIERLKNGGEAIELVDELKEARA